MKELVEILMPGYLSTVSLIVYSNKTNQISFPDVALNYSVDTIRTLAIIMLFASGANLETFTPALCGYIFAGVAMKMIFDGKIRVQG